MSAAYSVVSRPGFSSTIPVYLTVLNGALRNGEGISSPCKGCAAARTGLSRALEIVLAQVWVRSASREKRMRCNGRARQFSFVVQVRTTARSHSHSFACSQTRLS